MPRRRQCADGPDHAPPLDRRLPVGGGSRAGRRAGQGAPAGRGSGGVSRQQGPCRRARRILLAPAGVAALCPQRGLRPALPLSRLEIRRGRQHRRDGVGARQQPHLRSRQAQVVSDARSGRLRVDLYGSAGRHARIRATGLCADAGCARERDQSARALQLGADSRRTDRLRAFLPSAFVRHGAGAGRWRKSDRSELAAALDRQGAALPDRAHQLRLPLCGDPAADQERGHARLHPHDGLYRALHGADPAEQRAQCGDVADAGRRHQHHLLFHRLERARQAGHRCRHLAQVQRRCNGASTSTAISTASATAPTSISRIARR